MGFLKVLVIGVTTIGTIWATAAAFGKWGVPEVNHPQGVQLRQESVRGRTGFFPVFYGMRSHRGGGLSGGK